MTDINLYNQEINGLITMKLNEKIQKELDSYKLVNNADLIAKRQKELVSEIEKEVMDQYK